MQREQLQIVLHAGVAQQETVCSDLLLWRTTHIERDKQQPVMLLATDLIIDKCIGRLLVKPLGSSRDHVEVPWSKKLNTLLLMSGLHDSRRHQWRNMCICRMEFRDSVSELAGWSAASHSLKRGPEGVLRLQGGSVCPFSLHLGVFFWSYWFVTSNTYWDGLCLNEKQL